MRWTSKYSSGKSCWGRDGGIGLFQALHVIISYSSSKQMGLDLSALLKRCIVSGTGSTIDCSCHEWTTTLLGCSTNITIVDYDLNMSFHCTGCRQSLLIWTYFDTTEDFSSYEQHMWKSCMCLTVFFLLKYTPSAIWNGVACFLMALVMIMSN